MLQAEWQFSRAGQNDWHDAAVPGTVHTDLLACKKIPDPFSGTNETAVQWVENQDWEYRGTFQVTPALLANQHVDVRFEGLDTYANVYLNDSLVLKADNMFRSWTIEARPFLKAGKNQFRIVFESAVKKGKALAATLSYTLPGDEKVFTRKAQYQYGWDFAPRLVTCGIWKPIYIQGWNDAKIEDACVVQKQIDTAIVNFDVQVHIYCTTPGNYQLNIFNNETKALIHQAQHALKTGENVISIPHSIRHPALWNCNEQGSAKIYAFELSLLHNNKQIDKQDVKSGFRKIELVQDTDSAGRTFYFKINGKAVFMKGANYIPPDVFLPRVSPGDYEQIVESAANAHMNMLRVWGGGVYADEAFLDACDKKGILVWHDFMFACAMYPGDTAFVNNVKQEVKEQVIRLRKHPCMALWCGNNEVSEGWYNWGWQKQYAYSKSDSARIMKDYTQLFQNLIPETIQSCAPEMPYWPSSPEIGWGHKESLKQGDSHYWGVWWGHEPFETYGKKVGRFMTEYGFQSAPGMETLKWCCGDSMVYRTSPCIQAHQKHPAGFETINEYLERDLFVPTKFTDYLYATQWLQAWGIGNAIKTHRRSAPYCMGTLFWQLNDCWPVTSWSASDYYKRPKYMYYAAKRAFEPVLLSGFVKNNHYCLSFSNDKDESYTGALTYSLKTMDGKVIWSYTDMCVMLAHETHTLSLFRADSLTGHDPSEVYVSVEFTSGKFQASCIDFLVPPKNLKLKEPHVVIKPVQGGFSVSVSNLALGIELPQACNPYFCKPLEDNFFDLQPGQTRLVHVDSKYVPGPGEIKTRSLYDIFQNEKMHRQQK
ncbi:MAG: glycoside hydrolase family 2 protein [Bacteroidetes bacterium]|nr:glycoside hydrolase family 2 protein [Bacteroidota bacterium]